MATPDARAPGDERWVPVGGKATGTAAVANVAGEGAELRRQRRDAGRCGVSGSLCGKPMRRAFVANWRGERGRSS